MIRSTNPTSVRRRATLAAVLGATALTFAACAAPSPSVDPTAAANASTVLAQPTPGLPSGDLSRGADNFYRSDRVIAQTVTFPTQYRSEIEGTLFVPRGAPATSNPAIVVGHPMGAVREQSANLYATKMAEQGFVTLTLDLPFWGDSAGDPRNAVSPDMYSEAFSAAVDHLRTRPQVDPERIGAIGICGSGSFVISAAKIDPRIRAVATASMYDMGTVTRSGLGGAVTPAQRQGNLAQAAAQRDAEARGDATAFTGGTPQSIDENSTAIEREFYDFYRTARGHSPQTSTQPTLSSNATFANFYPFADIETISPRPMLFITGSESHSREFTENAFRLAGPAKEMVVVPDAGHVDLYDRTELIPFDRLTTFFQGALADTAP